MTTDTEAPDELEVPHLKASLWHELADLHQDRQHSQKIAPPAVVNLTPHRSRRSRAVLAAAAAAVVAGVVTAQLVGTSSETPLMGRIVAATDEATASSIVHWVDEQTRPGEAEPSTMSENWADGISGAARFRLQGGQLDQNVDVGPLIGPTIDSTAHSGQRVVDYCTRQYVDHVDTGGASTDVDPDALGSLRNDVAAGRLVEDGTEVVDGRELIRLTGIEGTGTAGHVVLVDPDSYLPVSARGTLDSGETFSQTYEYLPRTPENLALLLPPVPEGFTEFVPLGIESDFATCDGP
jgi:hypothetical protein